MKIFRVQTWGQGGHQDRALEHAQGEGGPHRCPRAAAPHAGPRAARIAHNSQSQIPKFSTAGDLCCCSRTRRGERREAFGLYFRGFTNQPHPRASRMNSELCGSRSDGREGRWAPTSVCGANDRGERTLFEMWKRQWEISERSNNTQCIKHSWNSLLVPPYCSNGFMILLN